MSDNRWLPKSGARKPIRGRVGTTLRIEELESRVAPANDLFAVPGATAAVVRFDKGFSDAFLQSEIGVYRVDDAAGSINGILPGNIHYTGQALLRAQTALAAGAGEGASNSLTFGGGQLLGLYMVSGGSLAQALAGQRAAFFSFDLGNFDLVDHVQTTARADGGTEFRFEDLAGGGDFDYDDAIISVTVTRVITPPAALGQTIKATFVQVQREAAYKNEFGIISVDGPDGNIGGVKPGEDSYLALALGSRQMVFSDTFLPGLTTNTLTLAGGKSFIFYMIANGTGEQVLAHNPLNAVGGGPIAYFSFPEASADGVDHMRWNSANEFGWEDLPGGGDRDFNDLVISFAFGTPEGTPTIADTTPPTGTFRLTNDTGSSSTDNYTNNAGITANITDSQSPLARVQVAVDTPSAGRFRDFLSAVQANGTLSLTAAQLATINGSALTDGQHTVFFDLADTAGNSTRLQFTFTLDTTAPTVNYNLTTADDTGPVGDFRTERTIVDLVGTTEADSSVQLFTAIVPGTPGTGTLLQTVSASNTGTFQFNDVTLANFGPTSVAARAVDKAGNQGATLAQNIVRNRPPTATQIPNQTVGVGDANTTLNLLDFFDDAEQIARFVTNFPNVNNGIIDINLFESRTVTTANFLTYVDNADANRDYDNSIFHRVLSQSGLSVVQGGGFNFDAAGSGLAGKFPGFTVGSQIVNEPLFSNTRGTISMAKGSNPNSATSQFFFNTGDNSTVLDSANNAGGFTVFGQVLNGGLQVLDAISALQRVIGPGAATPTEAAFPVKAGANTTNFPDNITANDLAFINTATVLGEGDRLAFSVVSNSNPNTAVVTIANTTLTIDPLTTGTATVVIRATDLDGSSVEVTFTVTVNAQADLSVTTTDVPDPVTAGGNVTYSVPVLNSGPSAAENVQFTDTLPPGTVFVSATASNGATLTNASGQVTGNLGTINSGDTVTVTIEVTTDPGSGGTSITNTASVSSATSDPTPGNNSDNEITTINAP